MSSFDWEFGTKLPAYAKNSRKKIKRLPLYISLWDCLENSAYVYTRHFHNWEIYTLFIAHTFPNTNIDNIKGNLDELLREFYIIHNRENMGTAGSTRNTNEVLNAFLEKVKTSENISNN